MNPTREQIGEWVRAAGWSGVVQTRDKWGETVYLITPTILEQIEDFAAFAYAAGLDAGLERAAEVCEEFDACDTKHIAAAIRALGDDYE